MLVLRIIELWRMLCFWRMVMDLVEVMRLRVVVRSGEGKAMVWMDVEVVMVWMDFMC